MPRRSRFDEKLDHAWNAGLFLREVPAFMARFGFVDCKQQIISGWRARRREFGRACVKRHTPEPYTEKELSQLVTAPMYGSTYGNWLGVVGPGVRLKRLLKHYNEQKKE